MAKKRNRWAIYTDETMERNMERLRKEIAQKDGVSIESITPRRVISDLLAEKYVEYEDQMNNRARITWIYNVLRELLAEFKGLGLRDIIEELKLLRDTLDKFILIAQVKEQHDAIRSNADDEHSG